MYLNVTGASVTVFLLLFTWFVPLVLFLASTKLWGARKFNWAILLGVLSWPAFALYLIGEKFLSDSI